MMTSRRREYASTKPVRAWTRCVTATTFATMHIRWMCSLCMTWLGARRGKKKGPAPCKGATCQPMSYQTRWPQSTTQPMWLGPRAPQSGRND